MREAIEGSAAIAKAVARCRPQVISAYPITPQTHIVEALARMIADGELRAELVSVESEFSAASVVLGAAVAGSRAYTATSAQGLLLMTEVLYNIGGLRIPLVLTCANRAVGAPVSAWNDQQDSMAMRDTGWIQLYCADNQEAVDTTVHAFRIAERTELPVMVCVDGYVLTHTLEPIDIPSQEQVDAFLPPYRFARALDPRDPISIGNLVTPEYYSEARHAHHRALIRAGEEIIAADRDWMAISGRGCGGLLTVDGPSEARVAILTIGSVFGTLADAREQYPEPGPVKLIKLRVFRPFPVDDLIEACRGLSDLIVLERALSPGGGGIIGAEVRAALSELSSGPRVHNFAAGLGGRDMPLQIYPRLLEAIATAAPARFAIFDLDLNRLPPEER
ncbi:MAG: pyruvate ferredoxin oxidoreductase [Candidatus Binataceae bacterium]